jgi:putative holliday junction resolvase
LVVVGIDYGTVRIGLAKSDEERTIAFPLTTVARGASDESGVDACVAALEGLDVEAFVIGLPLTLAGGEGQSARRARRFGALLEERTGIPVHFLDERLSSAAASRSLREMGVGEKAQRGMLDERAASLILDTYLRSNRKATWEGEPDVLAMDDGAKPRGRGRRGRSRR